MIVNEADSLEMNGPMERYIRALRGVYSERASLLNFLTLIPIWMNRCLRPLSQFELVPCLFLAGERRAADPGVVLAPLYPLLRGLVSSCKQISIATLLE